jgi:hypothetical protein
MLEEGASAGRAAFTECRSSKLVRDVGSFELDLVLRNDSDDMGASGATFEVIVHSSQLPRH